MPSPSRIPAPPPSLSYESCAMRRAASQVAHKDPATVSEKHHRDAGPRVAHELGPASSSVESNTAELKQDVALSMLMNNSNIRNVAFICPKDYGTKRLMDSLLSAPGIIAQEVADDCFSCESGGLSLCYEREEEDSDMKSDQKQKDGNTYLVNIVDLPGYTDQPSETNKLLTVTDGAILVADEGASLHEEGLIKHAIAERVKPVLLLNILDTLFHRLQLDGEEVYQALNEATKKVNKVMSAYNDKLLGDVCFYPEEGTIMFYSNMHEWGFTLRSFGKMFAQSTGTDEDEVMGKIWGDNFYDSTTKKWTTKHTGTSSCVRGFVKLCYGPIMTVLYCCMANDKEQLCDYLKKLGFMLKDDGKDEIGRDLMKHVMQTWLPANKALLGMIISRLPSPGKAQEYKVENLYKGPLNDPYANAIRKSDPCGPLMVYVSKTIPAWHKGRSFSVSIGRVYSGRIQSDRTERGLMVKIIGPNYVPEQNDDFYIKHIDSILVWKGQKLIQVQHVHPGNIIVLVGHRECVPSNCTITNENQIHSYPIRAISLAFEDNEPLPDATFDDIGKRKLGRLRLPYLIYNNLFLHQRVGVSWLWEMLCNDQNGAILADDMGLGKTRQVCTLLSGLLYSKIIKKVLIIAPASVVQQWIPEFHDVGIDNTKMFTNAKVHAPHLNTVLKEGGVLLTTYGVFRNKQEEISDQGSWDYIVMDEGHRAKERSGKISESLKKVKCSHKVIMTGTPLQNNLEEFFTLMEICDPAVLGDWDSFEKKFVGPIDRGKYRDAELEDKKIASKALHHLKKIVEPFVLRRTKALLKQTGSLKKNKFEYVVWLRLSPLQRDYFTALVSDGLLRKKGYALAAMDVARDISRHPSLLMPNKVYRKTNLECVKKRKVALQLKSKLLGDRPLHVPDDDLTISSKLNFIVSMVPIMMQEEHKILIFRSHRECFNSSRCSPSRRTPSSSGSSVSSSGKSCDSSSGKSCASSSDKSCCPRPSSINKKCEPWVFLMTTRVGGVGLNLTNASRVILADPADNPSDDNQAVDRAYRIGQNKDVVVYRLISCGDVEEHIFHEQVMKVESSISLLEKDPCEREICKNEGLVLRVPTHGFDHCRTHYELCNIHTSKFDIPLVDLNIENECVVAISNHSLLFSIKEEKSDSIEQEYFPKTLTRRVKQKKFAVTIPTSTNKITSTRIQLPKNVVNRLHADGKKALVQIRWASRGAIIEVVHRHGLPELLITGDTLDDTNKAAELVKNFTTEVLSEITQVVYVPKQKTGLIIGLRGATIESIRKASRASVEVRSPLKERKDLVDQNAVIVSGNCNAVEAGMAIILEKLNRSGLSYTVEEGPLH